MELLCIAVRELPLEEPAVWTGRGYPVWRSEPPEGCVVLDPTILTSRGRKNESRRTAQTDGTTTTGAGPAEITADRRLPLIRDYRSTEITAQPRLPLNRDYRSTEITAQPRLPLNRDYRSTEITAQPRLPLDTEITAQRRLPLIGDYRSTEITAQPRLPLNRDYRSTEIPAQPRKRLNGNHRSTVVTDGR